ncbi:CPBP family intramembrane glutamic endopeptidase [Flavihumibacter stibioxidans]|uniref:CAAX prenyl protease 2/Lysostaphin resistance protein A-like domain-containing protein n=1 Tax=Flavihumibacter stibioxidans TaxID=1834163 RepID=A0ABR7M3V6_9BACT|nr:CPBP family intramembrane glutamic endopeptidase [Flavihumibacter stibioxidans]MBC6489705.1 hypothetical protein [Flavihumibacter stibioxidans]
MFFSYFQDFFSQVNKPYLLFCTIFAAILIIANYKLGIEVKWLNNLPGRPVKFIGFYLVYLLAFSLPWLFYFWIQRPVQFPLLLKLLILLAPALFALKVSAGGWQEIISTWIPGNIGRFWAIVADWPIRLLITVSMLWALKLFMDSPSFSGAEKGSFYGFTTANIKWAPYLILLAAVIPLVSFAATQADFLQTYPKLKALRFLSPDGPAPWQKLLYELSYGSDFFTIELFFRGFLVVVLARFAGPAAILPMAVFYCSIHFGKPLLECISSYFGGILLGVVACYSQSILGGIILHLGLAWMMEIAALLAHHRH